MIKVFTEIRPAIVEPLEEYLCEFGKINWGIEKISDRSPTILFGYFETPEEAEADFAELRNAFAELPQTYITEGVNDADWQNKYKENLRPWNWRNLHFVPVWMKDEYSLPQGDKAVYLDAGMAFGTGDHATTRLCAMALVDALADAPETKSIIDAGCGSGILAISARLLGAKDIFGFDRDAEAVRISVENAEFNSIKKDEIEFVHSGIENSLQDRKADVVLANIISDVLCIYAENLEASVKDGGTLILSGILAAENAEVKECFEQVCSRAESIESAIMGDWSSIVIKMKK